MGGNLELGVGLRFLMGIVRAGGEWSRAHGVGNHLVPDVLGKYDGTENCRMVRKLALLLQPHQTPFARPTSNTQASPVSEHIVSVPWDNLIHRRLLID